VTDSGLLYDPPVVDRPGPESTSKGGPENGNHRSTAPSASPVFLLSCAHRTGSTLLQRLLNSCSDILIWGEHDGYLNRFTGSFEALLDWQGRFTGSRAGFVEGGYDQFLPNMVPQESELWAAAAAHVRALFGLPASTLGRPIWGFKEVRYGADVAVFLQRCFPQARFVHLTRDVVDVLLSLTEWEDSSDPWNREWTEASIQGWQRINASFLGGHEIRNLLTVRYEDLTADPRAFIGELARFLDVPPESFDETVFDRVLTSDGLGGMRTRRLARRRSDLDAGARRMLSSNELRRVAEAYGYSITLELEGTPRPA
jgi:hypothetical protein